MDGFFNGFLTILLILTSIFMILLILIQRGKGGGLAGAFGGMGGSSAFGTRAGDVFTKITIFTAILWFLLNMVLVYSMNHKPKSAFADDKPRVGSPLSGKSSKVGGSGTSGTSGSGTGTGSSGEVPALPADPTAPLPSSSDSKSNSPGDSKGRP